MFRRVVSPILICLVTAGAASADAVLYKTGGRMRLIGMRSEENDVKVDANTFDALVDSASSAVIVSEGYDGLLIKKRERDADSKATLIPWDQVIKYGYNGARIPGSLLDGRDAMSTGNYPRAIGAFREVVNDEKAGLVFKHEANYQIGLAYYYRGAAGNCIKHWDAWTKTSPNSKYTPVALSNLGDISTSLRRYKSARAYYKKIAELPNIPDLWKLKARLGDARVDNAERLYNKAAETAKAVAREAAAPKLAEAKALAHAVQAQAILASGEKDRYKAAETLLRQAAQLKDVEHATRALVFTTLGDVIYAQGDPESARYPYMRVACLYSDTGYVAHALLNAGKGFLDVSDRIDDPEKKVEKAQLLVKGMKLLAECAARHRGSASYKEAATTFRARKADFEAAKKLLGEDDE